MRSVLSIFVFFAAALPAFAQEPPRAPVPAPGAKDYPAFDGGTRVEFYAEQNIYRAYLANPADFTLFEETFVAGDFGGDLSFGGFSYSRNRGKGEPGPTEPEDKAGLDVSYTAGLGGRAFGARTVGCVWGLRGREELLLAGADALAETPLDLLRVLRDRA